MKKIDKIIYWVSTLWLCLGMVSTGIVQLLQLEPEVVKMKALGYSSYFLTIIGVWKILGAVGVLIPRFPLIKEWAYAGFFFLMSGAIFSHIAAGDDLLIYFGPALLLFLTVISWLYRPIERKLVIH